MQPQDFQDSQKNETRFTVADLFGAFYDEALAEFGNEAMAHRVSNEMMRDFLLRQDQTA
ncbi:MAG: hypothetical protein GY822_02640 [Deltaproteobacteria bacterium]|nr:hypothetical protein [Deltaproteobacteria bacterium]